MKGLEEFVMARLEGRRIRRVNVDCHIVTPPLRQGNILDVEEDLDAIDWRFVAGLTVQIGGDDYDRKLAVFDRVIQNHPKYAITLLRDCAVVYTHGEGTRWEMLQS